jgi:hypothetical protein
MCGVSAASLTYMAVWHKLAAPQLDKLCGALPCRTAGVDGEPVVFLFSDTQIVQEGFLEDINNMLNSGEDRIAA